MIDHVASMRQAAEVLPADVFAYFAAGAGAERTLEGQEQAWDDLLLRPRVLRDVSATSSATQVLGHPVAAPVLVAPTAAHRLAHPDAEVAVARATKAAGSLLVLSMRASSRVEEVATAAGPFWQQLYVLQDRGVTDEIARRAAAAGARALVVTVDTPRVARKRVGFPASFPGTGIIEALDHRDIADPRLMQAEDVSPHDLERLAGTSGLPLVAKGVLTAEAARACVAAGASAVIVSTHGGRQLDGVVPAPFALPEVAEAVGGDVEVYVDGGVRTGSHVLKALALGARAVLVGRPVIWALASEGSEGVRRLLTEMTSDVEEALALAGCTSCADVGPDLVRWQNARYSRPGV
ncbi:alpha-hydroxy acid oxidase [Terrabacter aerolatus]|uniref:Alpha-hydroxy-acid oxidizing enzyme n=1 Tax=Terrabacter aerolatus TaxID=422442 RepID=A0A512D0H8_9MICO|nr:alpha-hydroxy acid oxidase [Terrabacter aerolatus]GEO29951.1 alpha-hydroxy-acid oxidizing enzyme [Terrabacter aerolatus]